MPRLPDHVRRAIKAGPVPKIRPIKHIVDNPRTVGEQVVAFAHRFLVVPEGIKVGEPLELDIYQIAFILAVFDHMPGEKPRHTSAFLSIAKRNGKTFVIAVILLAYIIGPLAARNTTLASAAMSREQAGAVFELMVKMLDMSPKLAGRFRYVPSHKQIFGLKYNVQYRAISADARTGHGKAYKVILLDEAGQIKDETNDYIAMLETSQSNYDDAMFFIVSTQAPSDASYFSIQLDAAELGKLTDVVSHVYAADKDCDVMDRKQWKNANPGLGKFRMVRDMKAKAEMAKNLPSKANGILNYNFNQRVSLAGVFMSPDVWKKNMRAWNWPSRATAPIDLGLDLSQRTDLTAAVAAWRDDEGGINVETHGFAPLMGVEQRELRDKVPYQAWARDKRLILTPGETVDYEYVARYLADAFRNCTIRSVQFDRYRIDHFIAAAKRTDFYAMVGEWVSVGQGMISMAPRLEAFEVEALKGRLRTGPHPLLNMAASQAIAVRDEAGNRKLAKNRSIQRIDPMVAAVMAVFPNSDGAVEDTPFDVNAYIG